MRKYAYVTALVIAAVYSTSAFADDAPFEVIVESSPVVVEIPAATFPSVVTPLRFNPMVDLQDRNFAEAQTDISIRGGTFDQSGIAIGSASMYDPQTGHYAAEVPVAPEMLSAPKILTGLDQALFGFQAVAGSIAYEFSPVKTGGSISTGVGDRRLNTQGFDLGWTNNTGVGVQVNGAHSGQNGTEIGGESELFRGSSRLQYATDDSQTDLFYGHLDKRIQWPNLYALQELHSLFGTSGLEGDRTQTNLAMINHRYSYCADSYVEASAWYRRLRDDYDFDVKQSNLFNLYQHVTETSGFGVKGEHQSDNSFVRYNAQGVFDTIDSTSIVFGPYTSRSGWTVSVLPGYRTDSFASNDESYSQTAEVYAGPRYDDTNRTGANVGVLAGVAMVKEEEEGNNSRLYIEVSQSSQAPGYTALGSNASVGLFRGNAGLKELMSTNAELGIKGKREVIDYGTALFFRRDNNLTDWTYDSSILPYAARSANNVDVDTLGGEAFASYTDSSQRKLSLGYGYLIKESEYEVEGVDASFYALNYPKHRITVSLGVPITEEVSFGVDNEVRRQITNSLREGTRTPMITSASLEYRPAWLHGGVAALIVDNLFNVDFEEVPGVPGAGQLAAVTFGYHW